MKNQKPEVFTVSDGDAYCWVEQEGAPLFNRKSKIENRKFPWDAMPPISEQMAMPGSQTNPQLTAARFLLKPGRKYEDAVKQFQPCDKVKEENPEARAAGRALIAQGIAASPNRKTFIFVNNRLEGNAISTIAAMLAPQ